MDFTSPQDCVDVLKELEGFPLRGMEIKDGRLVFHSLSSHVALPMDRRNGYGYGIADYGLNKLDHFKQVMLFDEDSTVIAHVTIKNLTRKDWLAMDSPVCHILDQGDCVYIATEMGAAVELLFKGDEEGEECE